MAAVFCLAVAGPLAVRSAATIHWNFFALTGFADQDVDYATMVLSAARVNAKNTGITINMYRYHVCARVG